MTIDIQQKLLIIHTENSQEFQFQNAANRMSPFVR